MWLYTAQYLWKGVNMLNFIITLLLVAFTVIGFLWLTGWQISLDIITLSLIVLIAFFAGGLILIIVLATVSNRRER